MYSMIPPSPAPVVDSTRPAGNPNLAIAGFVLGCAGIVLWLLPFLGLPTTAGGLGLSCAALRSTKRDFAIAGLALNSLFLALSILNAVAGLIIAIVQMSLNHTFVH